MATTSWTSLNNHQNYRPAPSSWPNLLQSWLPVLLFSSIFAVESTATFGTNHTSAPLYAACHALFGSAIDPHWSEIHHIIRKIGHFSGYGMFSLVCFRGFDRSLNFMRKISLSLRARQWTSHAMAVATVFLVATGDEIHQTFLPNRTGCFSDVLLDTTGAAVLQLVLALGIFTAALYRGRSKSRVRSSNRIALPA
jgi:VanZ family protein